MEDGRRQAPQCLMQALLVVEAQVRSQASPRFSRRIVIRQIDFLVFEAAPQALREDVVYIAPAPVR